MTDWIWPAAKIVRWIDGDSLVAELHRDVGFHGTITFQQKLRLARINTPPTTTPAGKAAAAFSQAWTTGQQLTITTLKPYAWGDEWMAELTGTNGATLSDALVTLGHAQYWDGKGTRPGG